MPSSSTLELKTTFFGNPGSADLTNGVRPESAGGCFFSNVFTVFRWMKYQKI